MNNLTKAAFLSVVVFGGLIAGYFLFLHDRGVPEQAADRARPAVPKAGTPEGQAPAPGDAAASLQPIARVSVPVKIEVREKGGEAKRLQRATALVYRESDTGQASQKVGTAPARGGVLSCELAPGIYMVRAACPGYSGAKKRITVVEGKSVDDFVELEHGASITGRVLERSNKPVAGARVLALRDFSGPDADIETTLRGITDLEQITEHVDAETTSKADGTYELDGLKDHWYTVRAVAESFAPGEREAVAAPSISVDIVLEPGSSMAGTVLSSAGPAVAGAKVSAYLEPENAGLFTVILMKARPPFDESVADAAGRYRLAHLGPGLYNFLVEAPGFQERKELKVRISAGESAERSFRLEPGGIIRGYVRGPSEEPLAKARVKATPVGINTRPGEEVRIRFDEGALTTDDQGFFKFDYVPNTRHLLLISHDDFQSQQRKDVEPIDEDIVIRLAAGGRISGTVVDAGSGQPVPGATVSVSDLANIRKESITDQTGAYVVGGLGATRRPVTVYAKAEGYARGKRQVTVKDNQDTPENFELQPTGVVIGRVVSGEGSPLIGALVEIKRAQEGAGSDQVVGVGSSDRDGRFEITNVEPGEGAKLRAKLAAYLETFSEPFAVEPGQSVELPDIVMGLGGAIEGRVVDAQQKGIAGAWITARVEGGTDLVSQTAGNAQSSADGRFALRGLPGGTYDIVVKAASFLEKVQPGVQVIERKANVNVDIVLESGGLIAGQVLDADRKPVSSAEVVVREIGEGVEEHRAISDGEGRFRVQDLASKDVVEVEVHHEDFGAYTSAKVPVGSESVEIVLRPLGIIRGAVVDPEGRPAASFSVQAEAADTGAKTKRLNAKTYTPTDGRFEYRGVPDGTYTISIRAPNYSALSIPDVAVSAGGDADLGTLELLEGGRITGVVVAADGGAPVAGATVRVTQGYRSFRDPGAKVAEVTGSDGAFAFEGLKDGVVTLEVSHSDYVRRRITGVDTKIAEKSRDIPIQLDRGGDISGSVTGRGGKGLKGINIYLIGQGEVGAAGNQTTTSDGNGLFRFPGVGPGAYTVKAHKFGQPPLSDEVTIELGAGASQQVVLELDFE